MKSIAVFAPSGQYEVKIGSGLLPTVGREVSACTRAKRCVLVSGENVFPLYGNIVLESLCSAGLEAYPIVFPAGENTKCLQCYGELLEFLAGHTLTRSDCVIALGGGVTGDLAGFAASTFQRGIGFIQVPTTLFSALENGQRDRQDIIERCVRCKADIVAEDEHDTGKRRVLNLGHTFGHAVESRSGYTLLHGEAVAVGMAMISRAALRKGILDQDSCTRILSLLHAFSLPTESPYPADALYDTLLLDKKFSQGKLHLIVPCSIGHCSTMAVTPTELKEWLEAGI